MDLPTVLPLPLSTTSESDMADGDGQPWRGTLRYAGGVNDNTQTTNNTMMLRFRPILPKPTAEGALSVANENVIVSKRRAKRKYVRVRRNSGYTRKNSKPFEKSEKRDRPSSPEMENAAVVTLQLMPEKEEPKQASLAGVSWCKSKNVDLDLTVKKIQILDKPEPPRVTANADAGKVLDPATAVVVVESWVTVESVTGTCMDGGGLGCTDFEKVKNLETDTCPGFVSDGCCRVRWVNDAYKRMVVVNKECEGKPPPEIVVWLKMKDNAVWCYSYPAFTCGVRLQYTWRNEKCTKMVPCDVWRLECGGFAWRLDVKAALSLGL